MNFGVIFLCGFMGVGKTTVGKMLSHRLGCGFFDTDQLVTELAGKSIPEIFNEGGESAFRKLEHQALLSISPKSPAVVSLGGGALNDPSHLALVQNTGRLLYLSARLETLTNRLTEVSESRPLLSGLPNETLSDKISTLLKSRESIYAQADDIISTDNRQPAEVVDEIIALLRRSVE